MKLRHFLQPAKSIRSLQARLSQYAELSTVISTGDRRYRGDARYAPDRVMAGFAQRRHRHGDDAVLLDRICTAYIKSTERQQSEDETFGPNDWWRIVRRECLGPVTGALAARDISSLRNMYSNFFRDPCGAGLAGMPVNMARNYLQPHIKSRYKRLFLIDALHQLDLWERETGGCCPIEDLQCPDIGNPFGIMLNGSFVVIGAPYHHFYSQKIKQLLPSQGPAAAMEIGGGFGGMAHYLIRDNPGITYINFDLPESIALASYYLMTAFPELNVTLYGEAALTSDLLARPGILLMPGFALSALPDSSVDVSFAAHVLSDMSAQVIGKYMDYIVRGTRSHFLHLSRPGGCIAVAQYLQDAPAGLTLVTQRAALWNSGKSTRNDETECFYSASAQR